jgi:hypothetical protein
MLRRLDRAAKPTDAEEDDVRTTRQTDDQVSEHGRAVERTDDWYAQDRQGNVCYMGEDSFERRNSPLEPQTEQKYYAPGVAEIAERVVKGHHEEFELVSVTR